MNLLHLRYVVEVEKTGSITKAAQNLYMGQPNLSKAIKELEQSIGITIFRRTAKGVQPTAKGMEFLTYAKTILSQIDELESLYKPQDSKSCVFNVSVPRATYIAASFCRFIQQFNHCDSIKIYFKETNPVTAINDVASGESNMGVVRYQEIYEEHFEKLLQYNELDSELLWQYQSVVMMASDHPLADYADIPYHELMAYTEIVHGDYQVPSLSFSEIKRSSGMESAHRRIYVYDRGSQYDLLKTVPGAFMWVSPVPRKNLEQNGFVTRSCSLAGGLNKDILIYPSGHAIGKVGEALRTVLQESVKELQEN